MSAEKTIRVLIADDDEAVRHALADLIDREESLELVGTASDADGAISLATATEPDVALLDVQMPGGGGSKATEEIKKLIPRTRIVALSAHGERAFVLDMLRAGASSYLVKGAPVEEILSTLRRSAQGESVLSAEVTRDVVDELTEHLDRQESVAELRRHQTRSIRRVLQEDAIVTALQPIMALEARLVVGSEALSRFPHDRSKPPNVWFSEASEVGLGVELELAAVRRALSHADHVPDESYMSINLSPHAIGSPQFPDALRAFPPRRLVIEVTEHARVEDYEALARALDPFRRAGVRLAIDDAGAGFASLRHILRLGPDIIKLDVDLARRIHQDTARRALAAALISFAAETGATIVAEGIETGEELGALIALGVKYGQGFYLGRPEELE